MSLSSGMQGWFNTKKSIHVKHYINRIKDTKYTIISRNAESKSDNIQYPFMIQTLSKLGIKGNSACICEKPTASILLNGNVY